MINKLSYGIFTSNQLKIIALIAMTIDHIGVQIFPEIKILRIIGRIAFPIFAYMIAEGCKYTKNRKKYLLTMISMAVICQFVYFFAMNSLSQCILVTFSLSVALSYVLDNAQSRGDVKSSFITIAAFAVVIFLTEILPRLWKGTDFGIDYGIYGVMLPVFVFAAHRKMQKLFAAAIMLVLLSVDFGGVQWFGLMALPLLALYNGERGRLNMKSLFYIYYPSHLVIIYLISMLIK